MLDTYLFRKIKQIIFINFFYLTFFSVEHPDTKKGHYASLSQYD